MIVPELLQGDRDLPEQASSEIDDDTRIAADTGKILDSTDSTEPPGEGDQPARRSKRYGDEPLETGWLTAAELAEGGLLTDVGVVLDLAAIYLPVVGAILSFAVPTPFAILMLRRGTRVTLLSAAVAAFLITVLSGPHFGWRMGLEAIVGVLLGWAMRARIRPSLAVAGGTLLVAIVTFVAGMGVIVVTGLPITDIVRELRNILESLAWLAATGASILGLESQWLAIRPTLVVVGLFALHVWPLLLFCVVAASTIPVVASYYALANSTAQVLGHDVPAFPSRSFLRLLRMVRWLLGLPVLPLRRISGRRRSSTVWLEGDLSTTPGSGRTEKAPVPDIASTTDEKG
jgi:uncharacterized membrane protein (Fun14 family)